jgi:hypothetical protein
MDYSETFEETKNPIGENITTRDKPTVKDGWSAFMSF